MIYEEESPTDSWGSREGLRHGKHCNHSSTPNNPVNTPIKAEGRIIGHLRDHTFIKRVQRSKHMLRKPPAWCISKEAFCEKVLPNTNNIIIEDVEAGVSYLCATETFAEHAFEIHRGNFEPQLALTLNYWQRRDNGHHQLSLFRR